MGCTGSKTSKHDGDKKPDKKDKKGGKSKTLPSGKMNNNATQSSIPVAPTTPKLGEKKDEIVLDRNLINFINLHNRDILNFIVNEVKENLQVKKQLSNGHDASVSTSPASDEDTKIDPDAFITDVTSKAISLCKNSKAKTYTQLNQLLKESKLPAIEDKNLICDLVVDVLHKYLIIIDDNKLNKNFDLNDYVANLKQQSKAQEEKAAAVELAAKDDETSNRKASSSGEYIEKPLDRVLTWNEANKIARLLFLTSRAQPNIHASSVVKKGYIVTRVEIVDNKKREVALSSAEIDNILHPKAGNSDVIVNSITNESIDGGINKFAVADNLVITADNTSQISLEENLTSILNNYSNIISNASDIHNNNNNNNTLNDSLNMQQLDSSNNIIENKNDSFEASSSIIPPSPISPPSSNIEHLKEATNEQQKQDESLILTLEILKDSLTQEEIKIESSQEQSIKTEELVDPAWLAQLEALKEAINDEIIQEENVKQVEVSQFSPLIKEEVIVEEQQISSLTEALEALKESVNAELHQEQAKQEPTESNASSITILSAIQKVVTSVDCEATKLLEEKVKESVIEEPKAEETKEEVKIEEIKVEEPKIEEIKVEEPKVEEIKVEEPKVEEIKVEEPKVEEIKVEEPKIEEIKVEEPKVEEPKIEEIKVEEPKIEEIKVEEPKVEEPKIEEFKVEEPKIEEIKVTEAKVEEPKVEEIKVEEPKIEEIKVEEPKVEEPKVEEIIVEEQKQEVKVEEVKDEEPKVEEQKVEDIPVGEYILAGIANNENNESIALLAAIQKVVSSVDSELKVEEVKVEISQGKPIVVPQEDKSNTEETSNENITSESSVINTIIASISEENKVDNIKEDKLESVNKIETVENNQQNPPVKAILSSLNRLVVNLNQQENKEVITPVEVKEEVVSASNTIVNSIVPPPVTEQGTLDEVVKQSLIDDRFYNNNSFKENTPVNNLHNETAATKIQSSFRSHQEREELHQQVQETKKAEEPKHEVSHHEEPPKHEISHPEEKVELQRAAPHDELAEQEALNHAAVKIQSTYRGFVTRKEIEEILGDIPVENVALEVKEEHHVSNVVQENPVVEKVAEPVVDPASIVDITNLITQIETEANTSASIDNSLIDKAATKIQSTYRGYKTRTEFKKQKILNGQVVEVLTSSIIENSVDAPKTLSAESQSLENSISQNQQIITEAHQVSQNDQQETAQSQTLDTSKLVDEPINSNNQSKDLNDAATKIQSTYRVAKENEDPVDAPAEPANKVENNEEGKNSVHNKEIMSDEPVGEQGAKKVANDIDDGEESVHAALKIQATFRGYQTRKELSKIKHENKEETQ